MIYESTKSCFEGNLACINLCIELHGERIVLLVISACYNRVKVKHNNFITENEVINTIVEMEKYCTKLKNVELHGERIVLLVISACYNRAKVKHNNNFITENEVINTIAEMEKYCTQLKNAPWVFNNLILIEIEIKPCIRKLKVELNSNLLNKLK